MHPSPGDPSELVPGYGLAPPTELDFQLALCRQLGSQAGEEAWDAVCRAAALPARGRPLAQAELQQLAARLMEERGPVALVGRSMLIRVRAYGLLARGVAHAAAPRPPRPAPPAAATPASPVAAAPGAAPPPTHTPALR